MAAIDKLWIKDFYNLDDLRRWAIVYYPKLFIWLNTTLTKGELEEFKVKHASDYKRIIEKQWKEASSDGTVNSAVAYFKSKGYSDEDATWNANELYKEYRTSINEIYNKVDYPVMNAPLKVDKKLKWICPVPCVREYLQKQCGVKERWYYKLFWRGKKYFSY